MRGIQLIHRVNISIIPDRERCRNNEAPCDEEAASVHFSCCHYQAVICSLCMCFLCSEEPEETKEFLGFSFYLAAIFLDVVKQKVCSINSCDAKVERCSIERAGETDFIRYPGDRLPDYG